MREASTLDELAASFVDRRDSDRRFVGIDPDQDLHKTFMSARTSVSVEPLPLAREGHSDFVPCTHLF